MSAVFDDRSVEQQRLVFTGDINTRSPFELLDEEDYEDLGELAIYSSDETDLYIFDYLDGGRGNTYITFHFQESDEVTKLDSISIEKIPKFIDSIENHRLSYSTSDVFWGSGNGFSRLTNSIRESKYVLEDYMKDIDEFYNKESENIV